MDNNELSTNLAEVGTDVPDINVGELISREQAIETFKDCAVNGVGIDGIVDALEQLPPANCSEIPNNSDTISRQAAIEAFRTYFMDGFDEDKWWNSTHVLAAIEGLPPAEPKRGKWIHDGSKWKNRWVCSECGYKLFFDCIKGAYCPHCGADMRGKQDE